MKIKIYKDKNKKIIDAISNASIKYILPYLVCNVDYKINMVVVEAGFYDEERAKEYINEKIPIEQKFNYEIVKIN